MKVPAKEGKGFRSGNSKVPTFECSAKELVVWKCTTLTIACRFASQRRTKLCMTLIPQKLSNLTFRLPRLLLVGLSNTVIWFFLPILCLKILKTLAFTAFVSSSQLLQAFLDFWFLNALPVGTTNEDLSLDASSEPPIRSTCVSSTRSPAKKLHHSRLIAWRNIANFIYCIFTSRFATDVILNTCKCVIRF